MSFDDVKRRLQSSPTRQVGTGATEAEIHLAEHQLGVQIRGPFRDFLKTFGWGGAGSFELYGLGHDAPEHLNLARLTESERVEMRPRLPANLLPIMNDGGGNLCCLDTSCEQPPVVLWDHEAGEDQVPTLEATSFDEWLLHLVESSR